MPAPVSSKRRRQRSLVDVLVDHARFVGPGVLAAVAYFDPGNWSTDLAAGSEFGYKLLFMVLMAGLGAILFQVLAMRLGIVTGMDLAQHLRLHLHSRPSHRLLWRWLALYPLYFLAEFAIVATDIAELLGSAIALNLLFPKLPLYAGVLLTAADVLLVLLLYSPDGGSRGMRLFELVVTLLTLGVFVSFFYLLVRVSPEWSEVFRGYLPNSTVVRGNAIYTSVGIIGATIMPHSLFLGSRIATIDRLSCSNNIGLRSEAEAHRAAPPVVDRKTTPLHKLFAKHLANGQLNEKAALIGEGDPAGRAESVCKHLLHGTFDIAVSLLTIAVPINSAILVIASSTYYYAPGHSANGAIADLFDAYALIRSYVGAPSATLFAFALLCAGQSASIAATLAGQVVSEGFIQWHLSPWLRRLFTRLLGIVPSLVIAVSIGRAGIVTLLNASQVVLSIVLPFVVGPLIWLTSRKETMRVWAQLDSDADSGPATDEDGQARVGAGPEAAAGAGPGAQAEAVAGEWVDHSLSWPVALLGWAVFAVLCVANIYMLAQLALRDS